MAVCCKPKLYWIPKKPKFINIIWRSVIATCGDTFIWSLLLLIKRLKKSPYAGSGSIETENRLFC